MVEVLLAEALLSTEKTSTHPRVHDFAGKLCPCRSLEGCSAAVDIFWVCWTIPPLIVERWMAFVS